jgi:hypothetical protein
MHGSIYLVQDAGSLVAMTEQPYAVEDVLQRLLADYPSLLAGDQMDSVAPRQWVLVRREAGIPSEEGGAGRWALDHLFLDQDAVPTFVEVKRSVDTRIRREVVGQMLDYAANAVVYWSAEVLRAQFEAACEAEGRDPVTAFADAFGPTVDPETFWANAKRNLQAGKVRLVFVADVIPPELLRVVEFLNGQMNPAEVLAVEIKQFVGQGLQALVPRVVGQTEAAGDAVGRGIVLPRPRRTAGGRRGGGRTENPRLGARCRAPDLVGQGQAGRVVFPHAGPWRRAALARVCLDVWQR